MKTSAQKTLFGFALFFYLIGLLFFFYKYVPFIKPFLMVFSPILVVMFLSASIKREWGILFFVFVFPLINSLPYFFGIFEHIPHAPLACVLFLVFLLGFLVNYFFKPSPLVLDFSVFKPVSLFILLAAISGIITFLRYANFAPFLADGIHELIVNTNGVRVGGALMSTIFNFLNYSTGAVLFLILVNCATSREFVNKILAALSFSIFVFLFFAFVQKFYSLSLGNLPYWVYLGQLNSTFKDPNSLGAAISAVFPLLLGMILASRTSVKICLAGISILCLVVLTFSGSRSSFLALIVSLVVFLFLLLSGVQKASSRMRYSVLAVFLIGAFLLVLVFSPSILSDRLDMSFKLVEQKISLDRFLNRRLQLWPAAAMMIRDYPFTGVGLGAYIIELPNYFQDLDLPYKFTDSALNYVLQVSSELGLVGLLLVLWLAWEVLGQMRRGWRQFPPGDRSRFIYIGLVASLSAFSVNFLFHTYIGSFEMKYLFWLLIALIFVFPQTRQRQDSAGLIQRLPLTPAILALFIVYGGTQIWNSTHSLSLENRGKKFGWSQNFGLYEAEKDGAGYPFHWAKKASGISVDRLPTVFVQPIMASHPDLEENPVKVRIFQCDAHFRKKKLLKEIQLSKREWTNFEHAFAPSSGEEIYLRFETDRTWQPYRYQGTPDMRNLGIALGEWWYRCPPVIPEESIRSAATISAANWQGEGTSLYWNGESSLRFRVDEPQAGLRLWVRGEQASGRGPLFAVKLDHVLIAKTLLAEESWTPLFLSSRMSRGEHTLTVEFINDFNDPGRGEDRNLFLGDLDIITLIGGDK